MIRAGLLKGEVAEEEIPEDRRSVTRIFERDRRKGIDLKRKYSKESNREVDPRKMRLKGKKLQSEKRGEEGLEK